VKMHDNRQKKGLVPRYQSNYGKFLRIRFLKPKSQISYLYNRINICRSYREVMWKL
jgi:hypothetical protein